MQSQFHRAVLETPCGVSPKSVGKPLQLLNSAMCSTNHSCLYNHHDAHTMQNTMVRRIVVLQPSLACLHNKASRLESEMSKQLVAPGWRQTPPKACHQPLLPPCLPLAATKAAKADQSTESSQANWLKLGKNYNKQSCSAANSKSTSCCRV